MLHADGVRFARALVAGFGEDVHGPVHDDAPPVERPVRLIDFERDPRRVRERREFRPEPCAQVDGTVSEDVAQRLDVDAVVEAVRDASDVIAGKQLRRLTRVELTKRRVWYACHWFLRLSTAVTNEGRCRQSNPLSGCGGAMRECCPTRCREKS